METIVLRTFNTSFSASILLTRLRAEGIHGFLKDEHIVGVNPLLNNAVGGVKLLVDVRDAEKAIMLIEEFEEEYISTAVCPNCHRTEFSLVTRLAEPNIVIKLLSKLFGKKASLQVERSYKCGHCNYESEFLPLNSIEQN